MARNKTLKLVKKKIIEHIINSHSKIVGMMKENLFIQLLKYIVRSLNISLNYFQFHTSVPYHKYVEDRLFFFLQIKLERNIYNIKKLLYKNTSQKYSSFENK